MRCTLASAGTVLATTVGRHEFTEAQFNTLERTLDEWLTRYPHATLCGHRDFDYTDKTCPNFDVASWWQQRKHPPA